MKSYLDAVENIYKEKEKLLIIGLTGRTGSGCSTVAKILERPFEKLDFSLTDREEFTDADRYKFEIIKEYISAEKRWVPFQTIQGSCVILSFVFEMKDSNGKPSSEQLIKYLRELQKHQDGVNFNIANDEKLFKELEGIDYIYEDVQKCPIDKLEQIIKNKQYKQVASFNETIDEYYKIYIENMGTYKERVKNILLQYSCYEEKKSKLKDEPPVKYHLYTYLLQKLGNNIRSSGNPYNSNFLQDEYYAFAHRIELMIELIKLYNEIHGHGRTRICIDAIRNVYESNYLKDRYRPYYLLSISVDEPVRIKRLQNMNIDERTNVDKVEYSADLAPEEIFYHQNISNCFEMADIHLLNDEEKNNKYFFITWQLVKYITLMLHPGLITPTHIERCMQLAFNAKYNSGCLSRQVGAVVTGEDYAIKAVGWNDVPKGQVSCVLRNVNNYCAGDCAERYSQFENETEDFRKALDSVNSMLRSANLSGRQFSFCFKDVYNGYTNTKNQVYTRALHAEENAFLQISKYGGQGVKNGFLFCTASPCELCSKKAYQLGISTIYYIDPYPGISQKHILTFGKSKCNPKMKQFYGAIGEAYIALYRPLMPIKDELELVSGVNVKKIVGEGSGEDKNPDVKDLHYSQIVFNLEFKNREIIESNRKNVLKIINGEYEKLNRTLTWTGSSYDGSEILSDEGYSLKDSTDKISPYRYQIIFNKKVRKGDEIKYDVISHVKDETHLMHPYMAHFVKYPTDYLELNLIIPADMSCIKNVECKRYADADMKYEYMDEKMKDECFSCQKSNEGQTIYTLKIRKPNLFYIYSIEWEFEN